MNINLTLDFIVDDSPATIFQTLLGGRPKTTPAEGCRQKPDIDLRREFTCSLGNSH
jgi:hypothetical protein